MQFLPAVAAIVCLSLAPMGKHFIRATFFITTPLSGDDLCARLRQESVVKMLLDTGKVDGELKDKYGRTALSLAIWKGECFCGLYMISNARKVHSTQKTLIF